jgi:hypothetical protein
LAGIAWLEVNDLSSEPEASQDSRRGTGIAALEIWHSDRQFEGRGRDCGEDRGARSAAIPEAIALLGARPLPPKEDGSREGGNGDGTGEPLGERLRKIGPLPGGTE